MTRCTKTVKYSKPAYNQTDGHGALYIHIPFCAGKCRYCDFYSTRINSSSVDAFLSSLEREWELLREELDIDHFVFDTVYCGGGTPSALSLNHWERLCSWIRRSFTIPPSAEWSIECNPESFTEDKARLWLDNKVTRLSIGVQTLDDRLLRLLGRPHDSIQALKILESAAVRRFSSVCVDLMYGLPGQSFQSLRDSTARVLSCEYVNHLSAYELSVHENTPFGRHRKILPIPDENITADMMDIVTDMAAAHGLEQYEISNFAKPGHRSRHNMAYWEHGPYIGLGPSAHSYFNTSRFANKPDICNYIDSISRSERPLAFKENISSDSILSEMLFLRLRTCDGINERTFEQQTGVPFNSGMRGIALVELIESEFLRYDPPWWRPTRSGLRVADSLARRLL